MGGHHTNGGTMVFRKAISMPSLLSPLLLLSFRVEKTLKLKHLCSLQTPCSGPCGLHQLPGALPTPICHSDSSCVLHLGL